MDKIIQKLIPNKLYTSRKVIEKVGSDGFSKLMRSDRMIWASDNSRGEKLYLIN